MAFPTPRIIPHTTTIHLVHTGSRHYLSVACSLTLQEALRKVLEQPGILLWDLDGTYGIVPRAVIENAIVTGCAFDIEWDQVVPVHPHVAGILLKHAKELSDPGETTPGSKGNESESEG